MMNNSVVVFVAMICVFLGDGNFAVAAEETTRSLDVNHHHSNRYQGLRALKSEGKVKSAKPEKMAKMQTAVVNKPTKNNAKKMKVVPQPPPTPPPTPPDVMVGIPTSPPMAVAETTSSPVGPAPTPPPVPAPTAPPVPALSPPPPPTDSTSIPVGTVIARINTGSFAFIDPSGQQWSDNMFNSPVIGQNYTDDNKPAILGTDNPELYWSNQYGRDFSYNIPVVTNQNYMIVLHMAELFWTDPNQRIFNVTIEGEARLTNYDIVADTGGRFMAKTYNFTDSIVDGVISIHFVAIQDNAQISGIEVFAA